MISFIWEAVINFLEVVFYYVFINTKLNARPYIRHKKFKQIIFLSFTFFVTCSFNFAAISSSITILITCLLDIAFAVAFYQDTLFFRVFWGFLYSVICIVADSVTVLLPGVIFKIPVIEILEGGILRIPFTLMYIALIAVFVFILSLFRSKNISLTLPQKTIYCGISVTGIFLAHYILSITVRSIQLFQSESFTLQMVSINTCFILLFLFLLFYVYRLGVSNALNMQLLENQKTHQLEQSEYRNLIKATDELRAMKHDMKQHLTVIEQLANVNDTKELCKYIRSYRHSLDEIHHFVSSGNTAVDCILSEKLDRCSRIGIKKIWSAVIPDPFPVETYSLSSLLGNLWDNAIEACTYLMKCEPSSEVFIRFYIKPFHQMAVIHIENSCSGNFCRDAKGNFLSTKKESGHGIGLKRIAEIVNEANGVMSLTPEDHLFSVHIMIPLKEENNEAYNNCR